MISQAKIFDVLERGLAGNFLIVKFTFECNIQCKICVENSTPDEKTLLSLDKI